MVQGPWGVVSGTGALGCGEWYRGHWVEWTATCCPGLSAGKVIPSGSGVGGRSLEANPFLPAL